ncbi:MAG TPA: TonB-dependent receptor plug domain-containing protein [Opitutaceae bacterium]|nr:TonB-dependent receptor plug domain-containing protein [Opitutaceae bacterium]
MKNPTTGRALAWLSLLSLGSGSLLAQTAPAANSASGTQNASSSEEAPILLDPFTVTTEHEGYKADDTLAGGRVRTQLKDTPASLSVVTTKLMQDLGVTNAQDLLVYTNNTEIAGLAGNYSGVVSRGTGAGDETSRLINPAGVNRARGLTAMDNTRNYFTSDIPWDGYNISRIDISRGPNSFLFGVGSPSGIANISTNEAAYKDKGKVEVRFGNFGSTRQTLDYNKVIIPSQVAVRVDLVNDDTQFQQKPAFNHSQRAYGALRIDPKVLDTGSAHTKILANFESGKVRSNNPRELPPIDYITGYLNDPAASKTGYNPWVYKFNDGGAIPGESPWSSNGSLSNEYQWGNSPHYYWDADSGKILRASQAGFSAPTGANYGAGAAGLNNIYHVHTVGYGSYAKTANYNDATQFPGAFQGSVTYLDKTLSDPSIFDFYNKLIDGDNKREWQRWNTYDVGLVQSLFNERLVIQGLVNHEEYHAGQEGVLNSHQPVLLLDLDNSLLTYPTWLPNLAQTNPNLGRPATYGGSGRGVENVYTRSNYQGTAAYNLDFARDFGLKGLLASILGHQDITGLVGSYKYRQAQNSYNLFGVDPAWAKTYNGGTNLANNGLTWQAYLGDSMLGTNGSGANLSNLAHSVFPITYPIASYQKTWTAGTSVDPTAPWQITGPDGATIDLTQADNPANYAGYVGQNPALLNARDNMDLLRTGASIREQKITSKAIMYQGHFWDDTIIPSFGWRQDKTLQRGNVAVQDSITGLVPGVDKISDEGVSVKTTSKSYGVAVHLPKAIKKNLPEGTDVSLYYFHGANETPRVRYGVDGSQLPNEKGKTDDYSIQFDGFNNHLTVRLTYFKTVDANAAASYGQPLGAGGWMIDALPSWTLTMAAGAIAVKELGVANVPSDLQGSQWYYQWAIDHPDSADKIAAVLKTDFLKMFPQSYWDQYGYNIDTKAIQAGDWLHIVKRSDGAATSPFPWSIGGNNHFIHGEYPTIDQDIESKGFELEATFRPIKNWDITFNGSKATAEQTKIGDTASNYLKGMAELWLNSPLGLTAQWGGYTDFGSSKQAFIQNLWAPYLQQVALTGSDQPEWRKLKFNIISSYLFDRGTVKGLRIGAAFRWEDKAILGYGIQQATIFGEKAWITDVSKPIYGPSLHHVDAWIGYEHRLTAKIDWSVQLNLKNIGENAGLETIAYEPDGSVAQQRIKVGQGFDLTFGLKF